VVIAVLPCINPKAEDRAPPPTILKGKGREGGREVGREGGREGGGLDHQVEKARQRRKEGKEEEGKRGDECIWLAVKKEQEFDLKGKREKGRKGGREGRIKEECSFSPSS